MSILQMTDVLYLHCTLLMQCVFAVKNRHDEFEVRHPNAPVSAQEAHSYGSVKEERLEDGPVLHAQVPMVEGNASLHYLAQLLVLKLACSSCKSYTLQS